VEKPSDVVKVGDEIDVKIIDKDDMGRWKLSRKAVLAPESEKPSEGGKPREHREHREHRDHGRGPKR